MSTISTSNITSGFIDLATFDELEKYMYGGCDATAYFVRETRKATWFTQVPVTLSRASGTPAFGAEWSVSISRAGDYLLQTWLRLTVPSVELVDTASDTLRLRWTRNLMHNLIRECCISFNDLVAARFDNYHLDFWAAFTVSASKRKGYENMIGDIVTLTNGAAVGSALPSTVLNLPLPFFYARDSGVALPTAALPYNEMRISFCFRDWTELLLVDDLSVVAPAAPTRCATAQDLKSVPVLGRTDVWANYAIVSNDERQRMGCAPRDILIEQVQTAPRQSFTPATQSNPCYDIRFSHAIKALFFAVRNKTVACQWSNYTTEGPTLSATQPPNFLQASDPIGDTSLIYENTNRLANMGSDYFSLVQPWYGAPAIPEETGYHLYSYSLDFMCLDPMGSTNYGKLTNVSLVPGASPASVAAAQGNPDAQGAQTIQPQTYEFVVTAVNNNVIRISGGALGFPVL
jgi:hypothetical protein